MCLRFFHKGGRGKKSFFHREHAHLDSENFVSQSLESTGSRFSINTFGATSSLHFQANESGIWNDCGLLHR